MEIVAWAPPRSYTLRGYAMGTEFTSEVRCIPEDSGTRLEMAVKVSPQTFLAKLMSPLIFLTSRLMVKVCGKDLKDIAAAAERMRE